MKEELLDVLDENGIKTGEVLTRREVQAIKFISISELNDMREQNLLVPRDECYDELSNYLFRM